MKATLNLRWLGGRRSLTTTDQSKFRVRCSAETTVVHSSRPRMMRLPSLITESPADRFPLLQAPDTEIETQPDKTNQQHARYYQVIAFSGIARIDDEIAETGIHGDHLGRHYNEPGNTERDTQSDQHLWQRGGKDDSPQERRRRESEILAGVAEHRRHVGYTVDRGD